MRLAWTPSLLLSIAIFPEAQARTAWVGHPDGLWATVIVESARSRDRDENLCQGSDALRLYDALRVRAEAGSDAATKRVTLPGLEIKCENVTGLGFATCSLQFSASADVSIDDAARRLRLVWSSSKAENFFSLWDLSCAGADFSTSDAKFRIRVSEQKVEMVFDGN
jgi:hypothetical protein